MSRLPLGFFSQPKNSRLSQDYANLFHHILKDKTLSRAQLCSAIGLPLDVKSYARDFDCENETGALINPKDGSRNVAFKVETFLLLLAGIAKDLKGNKFELVLTTAGCNCGKAFGEALNETWDKSAHVIRTPPPGLHRASFQAWVRSGDSTSRENEL